MKKMLSAALALALAAGMTTSAFATVEELSGTADTDPWEYYDNLVDDDGNYDDEDGYPIATTLIGPFGYDNDNKVLTTSPVQYGETAYFLLTAVVGEHSGDVALVTDSDSVNGLKVKTDWEEGEDLVENNISVTRKRVDNVGYYDSEDEFVSSGAGILDSYVSGGDFLTDGAGKYYYMIAITIEDSTSTSDADIIGTLTLSKSKKPKADDIDFDIAINVDWEESYRDSNSTVYNSVADDIEIKADTYYSVKFDGDDEIEIAFEDDSTFTVDISGQGKTLIYYDTDYHSSIAAKYPLAELNFWNGNGAKFNRTGEFFLSVGDDDEDYFQYLYQVNSDGSLSEVAGAEYDESDGGFYFRTRTLGSYVYSDMELDVGSSSSASSDGEEDEDLVVTPVEVETVTPVNPSTGARA